MSGKHSGTHINIDYDKKTVNIKKHNEDGSEKSSTDIGCFLTTACMRHNNETFDDNCHELRVLRWFRDNFVPKEDIEHYYKTAPYIVEGISREEKQDLIYDYIYYNVDDYCVEKIEKGGAPRRTGARRPRLWRRTKAQDRPRSSGSTRTGAPRRARSTG